MDELEFRRFLERFPIVRFRDYHIDLDTSKRSTSHPIEEERQWKDAWSKGHKQETGINRGGPFWGKVREAAEKKILKENLLAALTAQSGIQYGPREEVMMAARHIADQRQVSSGAGPSHIPGSSAYAASSSSSIPNRIRRVEEGLDDIRHFQAYQVKHNQAVAEMLRTMALHHGMNMDKFPTCPSYMPPRNKAVIDDDDDYDDDDVGEEEDEE